MTKNIKILTYKRTHIGDPNEYGCFGIDDCMKRIRSYSFDAVIGIGGIGSEAKSYNIDQKINWVGINPHKKPSPNGNGVLVYFESFLIMEETGPLLNLIAPNLAKRMYKNKAPRFLLNSYNETEYSEAKKILEWSINSNLQAYKNKITTGNCLNKKSSCSNA